MSDRIPTPGEVLDVLRRMILKENYGYEIKDTVLDCGDAKWASRGVYSSDGQVACHFDLQAAQYEFLRLKIVGNPRRREWTEGVVHSFELLYNSVPDSHKRQALDTLAKESH
uniref:Uncharacterized protein n=1 Tax=Pseudomonas phage HRDY3 TaxID=3236930 RepID=A0AB39CDS7_9VIRU